MQPIEAKSPERKEAPLSLFSMLQFPSACRDPEAEKTRMNRLRTRFPLLNPMLNSAESAVKNIGTGNNVLNSFSASMKFLMGRADLVPETPSAPTVVNDKLTKFHTKNAQRRVRIGRKRNQEVPTQPITTG